MSILDQPVDINDIQGGDVVANQTSSIGSLGEHPQKASFDRWKTFNNVGVQDLEGFDAWYQKILNFSLNLNERITVRSIVKKSALAGYLEAGKASELIEGVVDLAGCGIPGQNDCVIVYLGKNGPARENENRAEMLTQLTGVKEIFETTKPESKELPTNTEHVLMQNDKIEGKSQDEVKKIRTQYIELLRTFGWDESEASELVESSTIDLILSTDQNAEQIVLGAGLAEWAEVDINGNILKMVELTEAVVHPQARGLGIYHAITEIQLKRVFEAGANIVYGESNLAHESRGVIFVAAKNGRKPANIWEHNGKIYEFENALFAHVPAGGEGNSNFLPTFITIGDYYVREQSEG